MRYISSQDIESALPYQNLVFALETAFLTGAQVPLRHHHVVNEGTVLLMPAFNTAYFGTKIVSVFPHARPSVQGVYMLANGQTGEPLCMLEGKSLTARRTAAVSALASKLLSHPKSRILLMVGAGALAQPLIEAHCAVRQFDRILLYNRSKENAVQLQQKMPHIEIVETLEEGVRQADVISCATLATKPLIQGRWLKANAHLDLVGGFTPLMREADDACLTRSRLYVDTFTGGLQEAGDIVEPLSRGIIRKEDVLADLEMLLRHPPVVREGNTLFKSVGTALADLTAAIMVYETLK